MKTTKRNNKDNRLKCIYAKETKFGDVICKIFFMNNEELNCDYGKGICKAYKEEE